MSNCLQRLTKWRHTSFKPSLLLQDVVDVCKCKTSLFANKNINKIEKNVLKIGKRNSRKKFTNPFVLVCSDGNKLHFFKHVSPKRRMIKF